MLGLLGVAPEVNCYKSGEWLGGTTLGKRGIVRWEKPLMRASVKAQKQTLNWNPVQTSRGTAVEFVCIWAGPWEILFGKKSVKTSYPIFVRGVFDKDLQKSRVAFLLW